MAFLRIQATRLPKHSNKAGTQGRLTLPGKITTKKQLPDLSPRQAAILQMQQTHGNATVMRMMMKGSLARPHRNRDLSVVQQTGEPQAIQRTMGDDHDLRSPRFAGDQRLEACFDDEARLTQGARGASVQKVQQSLIDLGFDLGPEGADGNYGQMTWNAVKRFKAHEQLGFETMGDVGPGTMKRLDELFPPPPSNVDFGEENDGLSCPTDVDIVTALEARPASINALVTTERIVAASAPVGVAAPHIGIPEAVRRFKAKVNVSGVAEPLNVSQKGQFFWGRQLGISVEAEINRMAADASAAAFVTKARAAFARIMNFQDGTALVNELRAIAATSRSPEKPAMQALVRSQSLGGGGLENVLWTAFNRDPTDSLPNLVPFRSLTTLQSLRSFDKAGCGSHAFQIAQRLKKKGGITPADPKVPSVGISLVGDTLIRDRRPMGSPASTTEPGATAAVDPSSSFHLGDFFSQKGAASAVAQMQRALDAGQLIHARVMSGVGAGTDPDVRADRSARRISLGIPPPEEHSLLVIGFDGSQFVFHDPDAAVSHSPENGFGSLFLSDGRLSTAPTPGEMPVDSHGVHRRGDKRYQVISLTTM